MSKKKDRVAVKEASDHSVTLEKPDGDTLSLEIVGNNDGAGEYKDYYFDMASDLNVIALNESGDAFRLNDDGELTFDENEGLLLIRINGRLAKAVKCPLEGKVTYQISF